MDNSEKNIQKNHDSEIPYKRKRNPWLTFLKAVCWTIGCLIILIALALWGVSYYFSPQRIARLIEEKSPEFVDADIKIGSLDYKIFSSYPWLEFRVDALEVISHSLNSVTLEVKKYLPLNVDSLLSITRIEGKINIKKLMHEEIELGDIHVVTPKVNMVIVSDSLNNFSIIPEEKKKKLKMPKDIKIGEIIIEAPLDFSFLYLPEDIGMMAQVNSFRLFNKGDYNYSFNFEGDISGHYGNFATPSPVPLSLNANTTLKLPEISLKLSDLSLKFADIGIDLKADLSADKDMLDLKEAFLEVNFPDLFALTKLMPEQLAKEIPLPKDLAGNLPVYLCLRLLAPYRVDTNKDLSLKQENLPALNAQVFVKDANLSFSPKGEKPVVADDIFLEAEANFQPHDSSDTWLRIANLQLNGEGISLNANARIGNLTGESQDVQADVKFKSVLMKTLSYLMPSSPYKLSGELDGEVSLSAMLEELGKKGLKDILIAGSLKSNSLNISGKGIPDLSMTKLATEYNAAFPTYPMNNNYQGSKIDFGFNAANLKAVSGKQSSVDISKLSLNLNVDDSVAGGMSPDGSIKVNVGNLDLVDNSTKVNLKGLNLKARGNLVSSPASSAPQFSLPSDADSRLLENKIAHTPLYLEYEGGGMLQSMLNLVNLNADVSLDQGSFSTPSYLYPFQISNANLSTNLNHYSFDAGRVDIGRSSFSIAGVADGIGDFLTAYYPVLIKADADIDFTNVDINQLAWGYYGALVQQGVDSVFYIPAVKPYSKADSLCVLIPRNILANIRLHSSKAEYMQYQFSPLSTNIILKDGVATLKRLSIGAPYADVAVDWTYSTREIDNIFMDLKADVDRFSFTPFYTVFPQVVSKAPELENLSGDISAKIDCKFLMYPSMFMMAPSLSAKFDINGSDFNFVRKGKIERITHLLLIHGDEPIKIDNFNITGFFHDNLLQINPFHLSFDDYRIGMGGINNMNGQIYYHLALEKSPFHLPFGVNLEGDMKHPEVRLGGTGFNDNKDTKIRENIEWEPDINIMAYLKNGWMQFIEIAAKYARSHQ